MQPVESSCFCFQHDAWETYHALVWIKSAFLFFLVNKIPLHGKTVVLWIEALQAPLSFTTSRSLLKLMPIESAMPSNHLILCCLCFSFCLQSFAEQGFFPMRISLQWKDSMWLFIHELKDIWIVTSFEKFGIKCLQTFAYRFLCEHVFISLG